MSKPDIDNELVLRLVGRFYDAVADHTLWADALQDLNEIVDATTTVLIHESFQTRRAGILAAVGVDTAYQAAYEQYFAARNPYYNAHCMRLLADGTPMPGQRSCPSSELARSEYYNDYLRKLDLFHAFGVAIEWTGPQAAVLTSLRPKRKGPWDDELRPLFDTLTPHLRRVLALQRRLECAEGRAVIGDLAASSSYPMILLDDRGRVVVVNDAAAPLIRVGQGLAVDGGALFGSTPATTRALRRIIADAIGVATGQRTDVSGVVLVPRPSGAAPLRIVAAPLRVRNGAGAHQPVVALLISVPEARARLNLQLLREFFGLTPTEAAVAELVAQGHQPRDIAGQLGISVGTVRWHLKHVLAKTETHTQADLTSTLLASPATFKDDSGRS